MMKLHGLDVVPIGMLAVAGLFLTSGNAFADDDTVIDDVNITVPAACTMNGTDTDSHNATINPGTSNSAVGETTIKAYCNDGEGFAIYAIGYTNNTDGDNTLVSTHLNPAQTIATGTGTSGNSQWAMKLATVSSPTPTYPILIQNSYDAFHTVPNDYDLVAKRMTGTDVGTGAEGSTLTSTYQIHISTDQAADTYTGRVKYVLVHPNDAPAPIKPLPDSACPAESICYAPNSGDIDGSMSSLGAVTGSSTAGRQGSVGTNSTKVLIAPNFSREGYGFAGWSTDFEATSASKVYGPNETITTSTTAGSGDADVSQHGLILYPVWIASSGNLQGWTGCSTLTAATYDFTTGKINATLASVTALTDERDGNTYTVARLADGNCWMSENLRLNTEDSTDASLAQGFGDDTANNRGKFIGLADSEDTNFTSNANANSLYYSGTQSGTATMNIGTANSPAYRIPRYNNNNTNIASGATNSADVALTDSYSANNDHVRWFGYGNYYNWPAAMANTGYYSTATVDANGYTPSEAAGTSLCPTGWKLPYGGSTGKGATTGGFSYLDSQMGGTGVTASSTSNPTGATMSMRWRSFPNNFVRSGYFYDALANGRSGYGHYWSSTVWSSSNSYNLNLTGSSVYPGTFDYPKCSGYSIRCIAGT